MQKFLHSKIFLVILLILSILSVLYFYRYFINERHLKREYKNLLSKIESLKKENEKLEEEIERFKNKEELERIARELYVLKKPDEKAMVVPQEIMRELKEEINNENSSAKKSFFKKISSFIWDFLKDLF